ncbi:heterokaryon incompatibility protein-domain-containing protein [Xylaria nigripes]|nr:heterokaryon incompatibility protein-domain-containing protein [Xylaria nigripes]
MDMATGAAFKYTAIVAPQTTRLIELHPGAPTDPVSLSLVTIALDSAPDFEAISYCWGNAWDGRCVTCNDAILTVNNSLFTGLVHFRYEDRTRILWADAICINQNDATEKGDQVQLMPRIYSEATRTLVWLGVANDSEFGSVPPNVADTIGQALQLMPTIDPEDVADLAAKPQIIRSDSQRLRDEGKPNLLDFDWSPLVALLSRPWFHRKWVVQEVVLAKEVILYAGGGAQVPWLDLARLTFAMEGLGIERLAFFENGSTILESSNISINCVTAISMVQEFRTRGTLVDGIENTLRFACTDPRDHVYSLLSLGAIGPRILPDYNASVCDVFKQFAIAMIMQGQSLKMLSIAPETLIHLCSDLQRLEGLPSWVPDLRLPRLEVMASYTVRPQPFFAGGHTKPVLSISDDERVLSCQGRVIDTIKTMSTSINELRLIERPILRLSETIQSEPSLERRMQRLSRWMSDCYQVAFGESDPKVAPGKESMRAFSRTMVCDIDIGRNRLPVEIIDAFPQFMEWATRHAENNQGKDFQHLMSMPGYSATLYRTITTLSPGLKFCVTEHGRFAHASLNSQPGDCICVLVGGELPFVARPTGHGTYTLVGECYVDGIMDGEIFTGRGAEPLETIHFE